MRTRSIVLAVLFAVLFFGVGPGIFLVTEASWFDAQGFGPVFRTMWLTRAALFAVGLVLGAGILIGNARFALASSPDPQPRSPRVVDLRKPTPENPLAGPLEQIPLQTPSTSAACWSAPWPCSSSPFTLRAAWPWGPSPCSWGGPGGWTRRCPGRATPLRGWGASP